MKKRIVIFASGSGTNAQNIIEYFHRGDFAEVVHVYSNKKDALVLERAKQLRVKSTCFTREEFNSVDGLLVQLHKDRLDLIVLAGFLWKFPEFILKEFPHKVINIHPALLPKYGGKGMYGTFVHEAVVANGEEETGISIHYVNEDYDEGAIIFQARIKVSKDDTPDTVASKIHELEYEHFPKVIEQVLQAQIN